MSYVLKRLGRSFLTIFVVVSASFGLIRLLPGGPLDYLRAQMIQQGGSDLSTAEINRRIAAQTNIAVDEPVYVQYIDYMTAIFRGDFGQSIWYDQSVAGVIGPAIPWTVFLTATALFLAFTVGVSLGAFMAYKEGSTFDVGSTGVGLVLNSTPGYVVALLFIAFLGYRLQLFPTGGRYASELTPGLNVPFLASVLYHGTLPILSMAIVAFGGWALSMRGNSIRVLGEDYLRVARLRGLPTRRIALRYVARNAILPMYTGLMIAIGTVFGGAVIIENIFAYPGIGFYLIQAINARDSPLMMGAFILITVAMVIGITVADLTYGWLDPRAKGGASRESY
ncbi:MULTISPECIES: ABC transporter permease [Haloferax]|uniref:ABC transporter permease n=1 Tax=Haloferax gibbonsii TaxID=35746 RepID=A0A0K1IUF0_HALGI|nr:MULTISPECIES: ABC transporter permease [Haloferax]AKU07945.1 ABC transporter permease [Haloferax gibbonsii]MCO8267585.1 ABC transporter permease [Haloferax sp. AB510]